MVQLTRMELENFGPFKGSHNVDLGFSKRNLVVFEGANGSGKSMLTRAIQWCLFGTYPQTKRQSIQASDFALFNKSALLGLGVGESTNCRVQLTFENKDGKKVNDKVSFSRSIRVSRKSRKLNQTEKGAIKVIFEDFDVLAQGRNSKTQDFSALRWINGEPKPINLAEHLRDKYFPRMVQDYYIIYGEGFVDPRKADTIKSAVEQNCFSDVFDRVYTHLEQLRLAIMKEQARDKKSKEKLDECEVLLNDLARKKEDILNEIKRDRTNFSGFEEAIRIKDRQIGESGSHHAKMLERERSEYMQRSKTLKREISEKQKNIANENMDILVRLLTLDSQKKLFENLQKKVKRGELPPNIKTEFIDELISKGNCVCGEKITKKMLKTLKKVRDENELGENSAEFMNIKYRLGESIENLPEKVSEFEVLCKDLDGKKKELTKVQERLDKISVDLHNLKDVKKLEAERIKLEGLKDRLEEEIALKNSKLDDIRDDERKLNKELDKVKNKISGSEGNENLQFITELIKNVDILKNSIIDSTRSDIQEYASKMYKEIFRDSFEVDHVELDKNYEVRVILSKKENGKKRTYVKSNFSTGEGLVFAISFLSALRRYSGYEGPIFLDAPFSVLDPKHKLNVATKMPDAIPGQLVVFTKPDDFDKKLKSKLSKQISKLFVLKKDVEWESKIKGSG